MSKRTRIKETYILTVERKRTVTPDDLADNIKFAIGMMENVKLVSIVNQYDVLRKGVK